MKKYRLLAVLILLGVLCFAAGRVQGYLAVKEDARAVIAAVSKHQVLARAVFDYKKTYGIYPDEKVRKLWAKLDHSKTNDENEAQAREIFMSVYNEMPAFKNANFTLTKNMGFSDGNFIYFVQTGFGGDADINGLISKTQPDIDYKKKLVNFSPLDFLADYNNKTPLHVRLQCLPLNKRELKVCRRVLNYFKERNYSDAIYFIPQRRVDVNDITF